MFTHRVAKIENKASFEPRLLGDAENPELRDDHIDKHVSWSTARKDVPIRSEMWIAGIVGDAVAEADSR